METGRDLYLTNLSRKYGYGSYKNEGSPEKEKPSEYKLSLTKNLPVNLVAGEAKARIFVNENCDIIFERDGKTCYYSEIRNKYIAKFSIQKDE